MAITSHPALGYENYLRRTWSPGGTVLTSDQAVAAYPLTNLAVGNLGIVTSLSGTTSNIIKIDLGQTDLPVGGIFFRFYANWEDITAITVVADDESTYTSPPYSVTYNTNLFPADEDEWGIGTPYRPIFRTVFVAETYRYWRVTFTRTTGTNPLSLSVGYLGPIVQLANAIEGIAVFGGSINVMSATEEATADLDTDFRFRRSQRRTANVKLMGIPSDKARAAWFKKLMYACHSSDILYVYNPTETDPGLVQTETLWGTGTIEELTFVGENDWEGNLMLRERL